MKSECIIVLGMHRSGTSALAGVLGILGVETGSGLMEADQSTNPKGFWENKDMVAIHDKVFGVLGSSWNDERNLPLEWWNSPGLDPLRDELSEVIHREYADKELWVIKDPRMCRLMPLWVPILERAVDAVKIVLLVRHPHEVALSLSRRDHMVYERSYLLWLQYVLDAERWSREYHRVLVSFEQLLYDWRGTVDYIGRTLSVSLSHEDPLVQENVEEFLDPRLRHYIAGIQAKNSDLLRLSLSLYRILLDAKRIDQLATVLEPLEANVSALAKKFSPWSAEIQALHFDMDRKNNNYLDENKILLNENNILLEEIRHIKGTYSWQITKPLRLIANLPSIIKRSMKLVIDRYHVTL